MRKITIFLIIILCTVLIYLLLANYSTPIWSFVHQNSNTVSSDDIPYANTGKLEYMNDSKFLAVLSSHVSATEYGKLSNEGVISKIITVGNDGQVNDIEDKKGSVALYSSSIVAGNYLFASQFINNNLLVTSDGNISTEFIPSDDIHRNKYTGVYDTFSDGDSLYSIINIGTDPNGYYGQGNDPEKYIHKFVRKNYKTGEEYSKYILTSSLTNYEKIIVQGDFVYSIKEIPHQSVAILSKFDKNFNWIADFDVSKYFPKSVISTESYLVPLDNESIVFFYNWPRDNENHQFTIFDTKLEQVSKSFDLSKDNFAPMFLSKHNESYYILDTEGKVRKYVSDFSSFEEYSIDTKPFVDIYEKLLQSRNESSAYASIKSAILEHRSISGLSNFYPVLSAPVTEIKVKDDRLYLGFTMFGNNSNPLVILEYDITTGKLLQKYDIHIPISYYPLGSEVETSAYSRFEVLE